jgi:hypothetical protein
MNKSIRFLAAAGLIGGGCWVTSVWGQQNTTPASPAEYPALADPPAGATYPGPADTAPIVVPDERDARPNSYGESPFGPPDVGNMGGFGRGPRRKAGEALKEAQFFQAAVEKLRSANAGPEREAAKKALLQFLEKSFSRDLDRREQEVAEIESRVKKLRAQIERRKKAKDEIVGLRLKTIVNETEGLGFSGPQDLGPAAVKRPDVWGPRVRPDTADDAFRPRPAIVPDNAR